MMHRFFVTPEQFKSERPVIKGPDVRHMVKVLRLGPGDLVEILDGGGRAARARIDSVGKEEVSLLKQEEYTPGGTSPVRVTLVQGMAKGEKMDLVIQKSTELGVHEIIPLACRRSVVQLSEKKAAERQVRWQRVALEAAKQCRRPTVPEVRLPMALGEVLGLLPGGSVSILPWEEEQGRPFGQVLDGERPDGVYIFIGPEGGFEASEVGEAAARGVSVVTLGPRILRTETAGIVCLSLVMHKWGDLG